MRRAGAQRAEGGAAAGRRGEPGRGTWRGGHVGAERGAAAGRGTEAGGAEQDAASERQGRPAPGGRRG
jgi:hypothetical protein